MMHSQKMLIVAISGKMRTGKTYCAEELVRARGFVRYSFAGPLKDDIREMGFPEEDIIEKPPYMRKLLQVYGQARRAVNVDHWANAMRADLVNAYEIGASSPYGFAPIVIDDMRFPNEAAMLEEFAFQYPSCEFRNCRMQRTGEQATDKSNEMDISEVALDNWHNWWQVFPVAGGDFHGLRRAAENMARE